MDLERFSAWCREEAARRQVGWFGSHVQAGEDLIHYVEQGSGYPLLLVHGFMGWSYSWRHNLPALAKEYRVLAPDLRGFGLSEKNASRMHSISAQVEVIRAFLDARKVSRGVLCGHSMGGEVCLRFALKYPDRVRALILVCSTGYVVRKSPLLERLALQLPGVGSLFVRTVALNRRFASRTLRSCYRSPEKVLEADVDGYLLPARAPGVAGAFVKMVREMDLGECAGQYHRIHQPALVLWGREDPFFPLHLGERLAADLPESRLVVIEECGHVPPEEHPGRFNEEVLRFLAGLPPEVE